MSKLLSDEELATQLIAMAKRIGASLDDAMDAKIEQNIISIINTQKRLYAEMVVGEDTPDDVKGKYPIEIEVENDLRAEQRERIK